MKISDFAMNKLYDSNRTLTSVNAVAWTAPELLHGDEDDVDPSVAVYSFGIILWEVFKFFIFICNETVRLPCTVRPRNGDCNN